MQQSGEGAVSVIHSGREAAAGAHKRLRQVEFRTQGCDHPILWAADQSYYLKFYVFQVLEDM